MANYSIPSSTPAIGRTSTPLSRRSRKQNSASASFFAKLTPTKTIQPRTLDFFNAQRPTLNAQRSIQTVGHWTLSVGRWAFASLWRVKGAWWSSRSSKPLSVPHTRNRGRFDSYPLRQICLVIPASRRIPCTYPKAFQRDSSSCLGMTRAKGGDYK